MIKNRTGETRLMNNGMNATIIAYHTAKNIDVQFSDGTVVNSTRYGSFKRGNIRNPNLKKPTKRGKLRKKQAKERIGQKKISKCGLEMEIIDYASQRDITVRFEDGYIAEHVRYDHFQEGKIANLNIRTRINQKREQRIGEVYEIKGVPVKIVEYNEKNNVTVQFPNEKTKKVDYQKLKTGKVRMPFFESDYIGQVGYANGNNERMEILYARSTKDMDVKFSDGTIVNCTYRAFKNGSVINPNNLKGRTGGNKIWDTHIGEEGISKNGQKMKIVGFRKANDIDVEFENGITVYHKTYRSFKKKEILNPGFHVGSLIRQTNGLYAEVIKQTTDKCTVQWEDGLIEENIPTNRIVSKNKAHPTLKGRMNGTFAGFNTRGISFFDNENAYYLCKCNSCGLEDILTPQQMLEHQKACK